MNGVPAHPPANPDDASLRQKIDACVQCGLCLPHCPTYRLAGSEAESPRGRIALAAALIDGRIDAEASVLTHLDHCLTCLSCQAVCPSQVRYEDILVGIRARSRTARPGHFRHRWLHRPRWLARAARLAMLTHAAAWLPPLARLLPRRSLLRRLLHTQPVVPPRLPLPDVPPQRLARGRIALFRGCVASVCERDTLQAARYLLEALGYCVVETTSAHCCGALPRHAGDVTEAAHVAQTTREALLASGADTVVTCSSGCHGDLREALRSSGLRLVDALVFLSEDARWPDLRFRALPRRAALHLPCTQLNVVGGAERIRDALMRIPGLILADLPLQPRCCGAAGSYFIEQADLADRLRDEKLAQARTLQPDLLLTTNVGCRLHLDHGLRQAGTALPVLHPLALLAQQLDNAFP